MRHSPRQLFLGMVAISATLHVLAGVAPWPQLSTGNHAEPVTAQTLADQAANEEEAPAIAITQLPTSSLSSSAQQPSTVNPEAVPSSSLSRPVLNAYPTASTLQAANLAPPLPLDPSLDPPVPSLEENVPSESLPEQSAQNTEENTAQNADPTENASDPTKAEQQAAQTAQPEQGVLLQLADDFPHLSGSQSGCYGLNNCHQASGSYRQVVQQLTEQMRAKGYRLTEDDTIDGVGHRVFEVVMPHEPDSLYYLNVFSDGLNSAVYAITVDILSLDELKSLQV